MKKPVYAINDMVMESFKPPMVMDNDQTAIRQVTIAVKDPQSGLLNTNPKDFRLFRIGTYNDATGELIPEEPIHLVMDCGSLKGAKDEQGD